MEQGSGSSSLHLYKNPLSHLRIVILDFAKKNLNSESTKKVMAEMLSARQTSFHRTIETYILMDKNDMLATHFLIYDVSELYTPKILSGIRVVYRKRCDEYGLKLPLDENIVNASLPTQQFYEKFKANKENLAECTGWYVDSNFSYSKTKLDLAQILFFSVTTHLLRQNIPYFSGATNERYKASHWVSKVGDFQEGHLFMHPTIPYLHKVTLLESFNKSWIKECFKNYGQLLHDRYEILPDGPDLLRMEEVERQIDAEVAATNKIPKAA